MKSGLKQCSLRLNNQEIVDFVIILRFYTLFFYLFIFFNSLISYLFKKGIISKFIRLSFYKKNMIFILKWTPH